LLPPELGPFLLDVAQAKRGDTLQLPLMADFATDSIAPKKYDNACDEEAAN